MNKQIIALIIALSISITSFNILKNYKTMPTHFNFEVDVTVLVDDMFHVFYESENRYTFTKVIAKQVKGSSKSQTVKFSIPYSNSINTLRFDISNNPKQKEIVVDDIRLKLQEREINYCIEEDFEFNNYIRIENGVIKTKKISNQLVAYDPHFISTFDVKNALEFLIQPIDFFKKEEMLLIAILIFIVVFSFILNSTVTLTSNPELSFIIIFNLIITTPLIFKTLNFEEGVTILEKRKLYEKPKFSFTKEFPEKFENYFNDNFGLRKTLLNAGNTLKMELFGASTNSKAVLGKDGYLFGTKPEGPIYESYTNSNLVSKADLAKAYNKHLKIQEELASKGIKYVLGFFPNKHTIYSEMLHSSMQLQIKKDTSLADQLSNYFIGKKIPFIDVRQELFNEKKVNQVYLKLDTHWNEYGAYVAYKELFDQTFNTLGVTPYDKDNFEIIYVKASHGDLVNLIGMEKMSNKSELRPHFSFKNEMPYDTISAVGYPKNTVITVNRKCNNNLSVLIYRDSFSENLIPFLSLHFNKVIYVWGHDVNIESLDYIKPDIVMLFCVERFLKNLF